VDWTAHSGSTLHLGTGNKLGLPYVVENFMYSYENSVRQERNADIIIVRTTAASLNVANTNTVRSPCKGNVVGVRATVSTGTGAGAAGITFNVNGGTTMSNLTLSITASSAAGAVFAKMQANATANSAVVAGDTINIINDAVTAAGTAEMEVLIQPDAGVFTDAVYTDPQTATTGDPRGLYEPFNTMTGSLPIEVAYIANRTVNASGRGGLHGIAQFFS
jgi:hypothetical protein